MQPFRVRHKPCRHIDGSLMGPDKGEGWAMDYAAETILVAFDSGDLVSLPLSHLLLSGPIDPNPQVVITGKSDYLRDVADVIKDQHDDE